MAVAFDGTRITSADALTESVYTAGSWTDIGGGAASLETDFFYQGSYSVSEQAKAAENGTCFVPTTATFNASANDYIFLLKGIVTTSGLLATTRATGQKFEVGSGGIRSAYYQYYSYYSATYPPTGGWIIHAFDVQEASLFADNTVSTPSLTAINYWGHCATMTGSVKSQNVALDAIEYYVNGTGLTWTSTGGDFQDFVDYDEGTTSNRYGVVTTKSGVIYCIAVLTIGSSTATTFTDSNRKLVFPWTYVGEGAQGIKVDLQNGSTAVDLSVCSFTGRGQYAKKLFFDTALEVNSGTDYITIPGHGLSTGDAVIYSREGGSDDIGPEPGTYWAYVASTSTFGLSTSLVNAYAGTISALTPATAPGENHSIIRDPDNRIDFTVSGGSGSLDMTSCIIEGVRVLTLTSGATVDGGFILNVGNIVLSTASVTGAVISSPTTEEGVALCTSVTSLANVSGCEFISSGDGHAIELTATGSHNSNAITYTGYWQPTVSGSNYGWQFHTITGIDSNTITTNAAHGFTSGDAVYYNNHGGSDTIGLTNLAKYYVNVGSTTTYTVHVTRAAAVAGSSAITLSDGSTGETHAIYGANAAIYNNSGGSVTINAINGGDVPSFRNGSGATATASAAVTIEVTGVTEGARVIIKRSSDGSQLLNTLAYTSDGAGGFKASTGFSYTADTPVYVSAASSGKVVAGVADDSSVFTNETVQANDSRTGAGNTMTLIPTSSPASPDAFYFGHTEQFLQMDLDVLTAGVGTYTIAWEYWSGSGWSSLTGLSDGTNNYKNAGSNRVSWSTPAGWATTSVTNQPGTTALYYVRARFVSGTVTTTPVGRCAVLDVTKYKRWETDAVIGSSGLSIKASWAVDTTATF